MLFIHLLPLIRNGTVSVSGGGKKEAFQSLTKLTNYLDQGSGFPAGSELDGNQPRGPDSGATGEGVARKSDVFHF